MNQVSVIMGQKERGLTLIEIIVVVGLVGILAALAIPRFMKLQNLAKASEAKGMLKAALVLEKAYFNRYGRYSDSLDDIGFVQQTLVTDSPPGKARYRIAIPVASEEIVRVTATSVVDYDADGQYGIWVIDESGIFKELLPD